MSEVITTLTLLIEGLDKKKKALQEIVEYTKAQEKLLKEDELNMKTFNNIMKNKQYRIDKVKKIDEGFQPSYERIRVKLEKNPELYREYINAMKERIKVIGDLNVSVQVLEEQNHVKFLAKSKGIKNEVKTFRTSKKAVAGYYNNFTKQQEAGRKNFYDAKK